MPDHETRISSSDAKTREGFGRRAMLVLISNIIGGTLGYISLFYMYRFIGDIAPGVLAFALSYVGLVSIIADLGYGTAHTKRISEGKNQGECIGVFLVIRVVLTISFLVAGIVGYIMLKSTSAEQTLTPYHEKLVHILLCYQAIILISDVLRLSYMAKLQVAKAYIAPNVENVVRPCLIVSIAVMHSIHPLGTEYEVAIYLGYVYLAGGFAYLISSLVFISGLEFSRPTWGMFKSYTRFALPVMIGMAGGTILTNTDKFFLQIFWGTEEVSHYFGTQRLALIITYVGSAIGVTLFPLMSELVSSGDRERVKSILSLGERYLSLAGMPLLILIVAIPSQIIHITLSDELLPATLAMITITIYSYLSLLNIPYNNIFGASDKPQIGTNITILTAILNVILVIFFVPKSFLGLPGLGLKAYGAALTTLIAGCIGTILIRYYANKLGGVWFNRRVLLHIAGAILTILVISIIANGFPPYLDPIHPVTRFYDLILIGILSLAIFYGFLFISGELTRKDLILIKQAIHPAGMVKYIRDEAFRNHK